MKAETITVNELKGVPHLKTCDHWGVTFLGCVSYRLQFANLDGGTGEVRREALLREQVAKWKRYVRGLDGTCGRM